MKHLRSAVLAVGATLCGTSVTFACTAIVLPANFTVSAVSNPGATFTYQGTVTSGDTLSVTVTSTPYLEPGPAYGINAAGVVVVAGVDGPQPVGSALDCATSHGVEFDCGSLSISITSGSTTYYGRMFLATKRDGLNKKHPPTTLTYSRPLSVLFGKDSGYEHFRFKNPTFTFTIVDSLYSDNTGAFVINTTPPVAKPDRGRAVQPNLNLLKNLK